VFVICISKQIRVRVKVLVFNATFINISVISCRSVLLVEETGIPGENLMVFVTYEKYMLIFP
jgi:hypothetical protein